MRKSIAFTLAEVLVTLGIVGVVAVLTLPSVIQNYQKKVALERLKKTYSTLAQAVQLSINDNEEIENWDFSLTTQEFMSKYVVPYIKEIAERNTKYNELYYSKGTKEYILPDGIVIRAWSYGNPNPKLKPYMQLLVDTNGDAGPNLLGRDIFVYYIFSQKSGFYNCGFGDMARYVPKGGLYPDGYGFSREQMLNYSWRGCNNRNKKVMYEGEEHDNQGGAFCTALIMHDGWQIAKDYKW